MLHNISAGRREMGDNSFLRDFRARMLSSRRAISWSMILRAISDGSPAEGIGEKQLDSRFGFLGLEKKYLEPCGLFSTEEVAWQARLVKIVVYREEVSWLRRLLRAKQVDFLQNQLHHVKSVII
jgi:hypothetical protein